LVSADNFSVDALESVRKTGLCTTIITVLHIAPIMSDDSKGSTLDLVSKWKIRSRKYSTDIFWKTSI
jgi:hypothetical protein